jgi:hypothetical protein
MNMNSNIFVAAIALCLIGCGDDESSDGSLTLQETTYNLVSQSLYAGETCTGESEDLALNNRTLSISFDADGTFTYGYSDCDAESSESLSSEADCTAAEGQWDSGTLTGEYSVSESTVTMTLEGEPQAFECEIISNSSIKCTGGQSSVATNDDGTPGEETFRCIDIILEAA